ncbi:hypothetical protein C7M84_005437 [Penaeus vannamei]|uniref:Uncharacterized protein n=1 Tax=Penaeus vannamei TaxID=6689 RepID=A0A423THS8_PENVA|nr:hypothetical protein C7M84_005437 [Penaeus vannamei]
MATTKTRWTTAPSNSGFWTSSWPNIPARSLILMASAPHHNQQQNKAHHNHQQNKAPSTTTTTSRTRRTTTTSRTRRTTTSSRTRRTTTSSRTTAHHNHQQNKAHHNHQQNKAHHNHQQNKAHHNHQQNKAHHKQKQGAPQPPRTRAPTTTAEQGAHNHQQNKAHHKPPAEQGAPQPPAEQGAPQHQQNKAHHNHQQNKAHHNHQQNKARHPPAEQGAPTTSRTRAPQPQQNKAHHNHQQQNKSAPTTTSRTSRTRRHNHQQNKARHSRTRRTTTTSRTRRTTTSSRTKAPTWTSSKQGGSPPVVNSLGLNKKANLCYETDALAAAADHKVLPTPHSSAGSSTQWNSFYGAHIKEDLEKRPENRQISGRTEELTLQALDHVTREDWRVCIERSKQSQEDYNYKDTAFELLLESMSVELDQPGNSSDEDEDAEVD